MVRFRGSDYRRSQGLTWYDKMNRLLMALGFTESKGNFNLFFKVEGQRPVMLLLYVDDLFLTVKEELIKVARRRLDAKFEMKHLDMMHYFLGMEVWPKCKWNLLGTREVCSGDPEEVQDDELQGHGIEPEAIE